MVQGGGLLLIVGVVFVVELIETFGGLVSCLVSGLVSDDVAGSGAVFPCGSLHGMNRYLPMPPIETIALGDFDESDMDTNPIFRNCFRKRVLRLALHGRFALLEIAPKVPFLVMS